jgi:hypothetical protein
MRELVVDDNAMARVIDAHPMPLEEIISDESVESGDRHLPDVKNQWVEIVVPQPDLTCQLATTSGSTMGCGAFALAGGMLSAQCFSHASKGTA